MKVYRPREELRPYVRYYWMLKSDEPFSILTFPIGCPQIIFHKKTPLFIPETGTSQWPLTVSGQVNFPAHIHSDGNLEMLVAVFYPHTIGMFINTPPSAFYNQEISGHDLGNQRFNDLAAEIFDCDTPTACIAALERWLISRIGPTPDLPRIGHCLRRMLADPSTPVSALAADACLGKRQFERVFRQNTGMNPKEYARIARFQKALWHMQRGERGFAAIAAGCGYADQPHLIRDFRQYSGVTPAKLLRLQVPYSDLYSVPPT